MLLTVFVILLLTWLVALMIFQVSGFLIHLLLVAALGALLWRMIMNGKRA